MNRIFPVVFAAFLLVYSACGCIESKQEAKTYFSEGRILENKGDYEQASEKYRLAFKIWPSYTEAHLKYQDMQIALGRYPEVFEKYRKLLEGRPKSPCYSYLCGRLEKDSAKRVALYRKALKLEPNYLWAMDGIGNELLKQGKEPEAVKQLKKAIEIDSEFAPVHLSLARAWYAKKLYDPALSEINKYCQLMPDSQTGKEMAGNIYYAKHEYKKAEESWLKASSMSKSSTSSLLSLANLYLELKNYPECGKTIGRIYSANPSHSGAMICEAWLKLRCGNAADAASIASAVLLKNPSDNGALKVKAAVFASRGDRKREKEILEGIVKNDPLDFESAEELASAEYALGNDEAAAAVIASAGKSGILSVKSDRIMRSILFFSGRIAESAGYAKAACGKDGCSSDDFKALAIISALLNDSKGVKQAFESELIEEQADLAVNLFFIIGREERKELASFFGSLSKKAGSHSDIARLDAVSKACSGDLKGALNAVKDISESEIFRCLIKSEAGDRKAFSELSSYIKRLRASASGEEIRLAEIALIHIGFNPKDGKAAKLSMDRLTKINSESKSMWEYAASIRELERERSLSESAASVKGPKK